LVEKQIPCGNDRQNGKGSGNAERQRQTLDVKDNDKR